MYFNSSGIEHTPQDVLNKINYKSIMHSIFRIQSEDSIICGFYYITFLEYMIAGTTLLDYANLLSNHKRMIRTYISI